MAIAVDTNILVRYFVRDHEDYATKAQMLIQRSRPRSLLLDRLIFAELGYILRSVYGLDKQSVVKVYKALLDSETFSLVDREQIELALSYFERERPLSFEDCWLLAVQRSGKARLVATFDEALGRRLGAGRHAI